VVREKGRLLRQDCIAMVLQPVGYAADISGWWPRAGEEVGVLEQQFVFSFLFVFVSRHCLGVGNQRDK